MEQNRSKYRIAKMAQWLQVSKSGYYAWRKRSKSRRCIENETLLKEIIQIHDASRNTYGGRKITHEINRLSRKKQAEFTGKIQKLSRKFAHIDYTKPAHTNLITKFKVFFCRMMQKSIHKSDPAYLDGKYWAEQGWLNSGRPWK